MKPTPLSTTRSALLVVVVLYFGFSCVAQAQEKAAPHPNILFIAVDDLNDWITPLGGHPQTITPNIERLCNRGVLFENGHCAAPACNPSRAALLWGLRPSTTGVYLNSQPIEAAPLLQDKPTLPQYMSQHGYVSLGSGKIFHGGSGNDNFWDHYEKINGFPQPEKLPANGIPNTGHFDWGPVDATDGQLADTRVADWVISQLEQQHDKPFFLACGIFRPHLPWFVPKKYFDKFPLDEIQLPKVLENDLDDVPPAGVKMAGLKDHKNVTEHDQWRHAVQAYLASINYADGQIGRVLDALEKSDHSANTYIVFWTDHGWALGEKQHWRKFALWDTTTRTPIVIAGPGINAARCSKPVSLLDLFPTITDLAGIAPLETNEGHSLKPLLDNPSAEWPHVAITTHGRNHHAIRDERYRYIHYADGGEELYDLKNDPEEFNNLADSQSLADVKQRLQQHLPKTNVEDAPFEGKKSKKQAKPGVRKK